MSNTNIDLTDENKKLRLQAELLKKEFSELFAQKNEMLSYTENFLTALYLNSIGQLQYEKFCLKVENAQLKQRITLIQGFLNRNEMPNLVSIDKDIANRFVEYKKKIKQDAEQIVLAKEYLKEKFLPDDMVNKMKDVYRLIVKRLHPDLNPLLTEHEKDLFVKAKVAYDLCDVNVLDEILLSLNLNSASDYPAKFLDLNEYVIKLSKNVDSLKTQIVQLKLKFPFSLQDNLMDQEWVETKQKVLKIEIEELTNERSKMSEYMLLLLVWKPESLN